MRLFMLGFAAIALFSVSAMAQEEQVAAPTPEAAVTTEATVSVEAVPSDEIAVATPESDLPQRMALATELNRVRPIKMQVDQTAKTLANRLSPTDRTRFMKIVENGIDYTKLESKSIESMASIFTVPELQTMVNYYSSPEAATIDKKLVKYQQKVQPEIVRMLDSAIIADRTGNAPAPKIDPPQEAPKIAPEAVPVTP